MLLYVYVFLEFFRCFSSKNLCFYHFHFFFFDEGSNISQSETGTGDQKLSVELYVLIERL